MGAFYQRFKLINKLSFLVLSSILISFAVLGLYFNSFLTDNYINNAKKRMLHGYSRIALNLKNVEDELKKGITFAQTDESLLASIDLINDYQDKDNYNAILLDEEKKSIVEELLKRVKLSLNDDIVLYDKNRELIAYVSKEVDKYRLYYFSYENSKRVLYSKFEDKKYYKKIEIEKNKLITFKHKDFYKDIIAGQDSIITYHSINDKIYIKSHNDIFSDMSNHATAHIEMSNIKDKKYFENISKELDLSLKTSKDKKYDSDSKPLQNIKINNGLKIIQTDNDLSSIVNIDTIDGKVYIIASLKKARLNVKLNENREKLFLILLFVSITILVLLRILFKRGLAEPLETLMEQIDKIERRDYSKSEQLDSGDELETISKNINTLAFTIRSREAALEKSQDTLEFLSNHDSLTNLPNRRFFNHRVNHAINMAARHNTKVILFFLDLDSFKEINDVLGHDVGDELLKEVSKRLASNIRASDTLARMGGDEFYILIENMKSVTEVNAVVQKIIEDFKDSFICNNHEIKTTASIGISVYPKDGKDSVSLIKNADLAMYKAKQKGGNRFNFFSKEMSVSLEKRIQHITALKEAVITCDEFHLLYQPKVSIESGKVIAVEALVRWDSSELGFMQPDQFISLSEETNLILPLGRWILEQACNDFVKLQNDGYKLEHISINVSTIQLLKSDMLYALKEVIKTSKIRPTQVELEITESYIATKESNALQTLQAFRAMGIKLAIDDFGTGYSSLSYLQKLPVTRLKIDKSFVDNIPASNESIAIAKAIIALGKTFNLSITAEGVEKKEQLEFFQDMECNEIQGYYYSKPLTLNQLKEFYKNQNEK